MERFEPQQRDEQLAPNPHRVELTGNPGALTWPALCPNCGAPSRERIAVGKVFRHTHRFSDLPTWYTVDSVPIPFCHDCAERHRREVAGMTPLQRFVSRFLSEMALPMLFAGLLGLFLLKETLAELSEPAVAGVMGGLALVFLGIAAGSYRSSVHRTARLRVPPQTSVTLACDYSDDLSEPFDGERRLYAIRDAGFAEAFAALNREAAWNPAAPRARRARRGRGIAAVLAILVAAAALLWDLLAT